MYLNQGSNTVSVINATSNKVVATIPVGVHPVALTTDDTDQMYVTNQGSNTVSVINATSNKVVATIPVGVHPSDTLYHKIYYTIHNIYVTNQAQIQYRQ